MSDEDRAANVARILEEQKERISRYLALPVSEQLAAAETQLIEYMRAFLDKGDKVRELEELVEELRLTVAYRDVRITELQTQVDKLLGIEGKVIKLAKTHSYASMEHEPMTPTASLWEALGKHNRSRTG